MIGFAKNSSKAAQYSKYIYNHLYTLYICVKKTANPPNQKGQLQRTKASNDVSDEMRTKFADLALSIFTRNAPRDSGRQTGWELVGKTDFFLEKPGKP